MSLDVYLMVELDTPVKCLECGCEKCGPKTDAVFSANITHNLTKMADAAGIYKCLWRPEEVGIKKASELITPLRVGLQALKLDPEKYKAFNAQNSWGTYSDFVPWVEKYLEACEQNPTAEISVSR